jgi:RNA polymerase sigma-70 factor (ECF subfamily)
MVGDDADDALQETYVAAYRGIGQFQPETEASFSNWLYRLVYTASIDVLRRRKRAAARVRALMERPQPAAWTELTSQQADLIDALTDLEPDLRAAVLLVDAHGVGYRETAGILGISEGTLASRLHRARGRVRAAGSATAVKVYAIKGVAPSKAVAVAGWPTTRWERGLQ